MKNSLLIATSVLMVSACDVAYQVGSASDAAMGSDSADPGAQGGSDKTRSLAVACDLWDTGRDLTKSSGGAWHWFSHAVVFAWGDSYKNQLDVIEQVSEKYLPLIKTEGDLECVTRDLLTDARARTSLGAFYKSWLKIDPLAPPSQGPYSALQWSEMVQDTLTFAIDTTAAGQDNFRRLYTSPRPLTFLPGAENAFDTKSVSAGLLSDSAVLSQASVASTPWWRGTWLIEKFLCLALPPEPAGSNSLEWLNPMGSQSLREQYTAVVNGPNCRSCHDMFDPAGFAVAPFDEYGRLRAKDEVGFAFDTSGTFALTTRIGFEDLNGLGTASASTPEASSCYASRWFDFLFSKTGKTSESNPEIVKKAGALLLANNGDMRAAIAHVIVQGWLPSDALQ